MERNLCQINLASLPHKFTVLGSVTAIVHRYDVTNFSWMSTFEGIVSAKIDKIRRFLRPI